MIIFIYGSDTYTSRLELRKMIQKFRKERDVSGYNTRRFVAGECSWKDVSAEAVSAPFLAEKRMVVLEGVCASGDDELIAWARKAVEEKHVPDSTVLVLWEGGAKTKGTGSKLLFDVLKKQQFAMEHKLPDSKMIFSYIAKKAKEHGVALTPKALQDFCIRFGEDSWNIGSALDMLASYIPQGAITEQHMEQLFGYAAADNVFACVEAVCLRNTKAAQTALLSQQQVGADPQMLLPVFAKQVRLALYVSQALARPDVKQNAVHVFGVHPFAAEKAIEMAQRAGVERVLLVHGALVRAYTEARSGIDPWVALQRFVLV